MLDMIKESADEHMKKAVDALDHNFASVRTGRANAMVLDRIKVDYYGVPTPVNQMAAVKPPMLICWLLNRGTRVHFALLSRQFLLPTWALRPRMMATVFAFPSRHLLKSAAKSW